MDKKMGKDKEKEKKKLDLKELPVSKIKPNPFQPRQILDEKALKELAASIKKDGLHHPITVRSKGKGKDVIYETVDGGRRLAAIQLLKWESVQAFIGEFDDREMLEIALIENLQREDLKPMEEARAFQALAEQYDGSVESVAEAVSKSVTFVKDRVQLLELDEKVQEMLDNEQISLEQAKVLLEIDDPKDQLKFAKLATNLNLKANQLKGRTQHVRKKSSSRKSKKKVRFNTFASTMINLYDMCEAIDVKKLPDEQKKTALQQIESLLEILGGLKKKLDEEGLSSEEDE